MVKLTAAKQMLRETAFILTVALLFTAGPVFAGEETSQRTPPPPTIEQEVITFDIGFWLFKQAARAQMTFTKQGDIYAAVVEAQTSGLFGFISRNIKETMKSIMHYDPQTRRLQPLYFEEVLTQGNRARKKTVTFNYLKNIFNVTYEGTKRKTTKISRKLPGGNCDDLLTAFYNLRSGYYGNPKPGETVTVNVCVTGKPAKIFFSFPDKDTIQGKIRPRGEHYIILSLDKSLTNIASKQVKGWLSADFVPMYGTVEDAYMFGDLTVKLKERKIIR